MRFSPLLALSVLAAPAALAQDDIDLGLDDIMDEIDLSSDDNAELLTYTGSSDSTAPKYKAGAKVTITHYGGPIRVRCAERDGIAARTSYSVTGTNEANIARMGKGIGISTYGSTSGGSVKTRIPSKPSGVTSYTVELIVNLPKEAGVYINGGAHWVQVTGCTGWVYSRNKEGGAVIDGRYTAVDVSSSKGDVKVDISESSEMTGKSKVSAPQGDATVAIPRGFSGKIYAKGAEVIANEHVVDGTNSSTLVDGVVGAGGSTSLSVTASGTVKVTTP